MNGMNIECYNETKSNIMYNRTMEKLAEELGLTQFILNDLCYEGKVDYSPNIQKTEDSYIFEYPIIGVDKENISVEIEEQILVIKTNVENDTTDYTKHGFEKTGKIEKKFSLKRMDIDFEDITSSMKNGILTVIFKKKIPNKKEIKIS